MTQDSDPDTTAATDSTDSSAQVIRLEQCYAVLEHCMPVLVTAKHCSGPMAAVVRSYAAVLEHCFATEAKFTNA